MSSTVTAHVAREQYCKRKIPFILLLICFQDGSGIICHFILKYFFFITVSEPSLKMRSSKLSLRQKVIQRNSHLMRKREVYRHRTPATCKLTVFFQASMVLFFYMENFLQIICNLDLLNYGFMC